MKPNAETHNPDPEYLTQVAKRTGLTQARISELVGVPVRTLNRYLNTPGSCPYPVQFALESLQEHSY